MITWIIVEKGKKNHTLIYKWREINVMLYMQKDNKKRLKLRKNTADSIPIITVDRSGVIEVEKNLYSMTITLKDVNYSLSRQEDQEDIFLLFAKLLNYFTSDVSIQVTMNNENVQLGSIKENISMNCEQNDGLDIFREEFNDMLLSNVLEGKNRLRKSLYITVASECKNLVEAKSKLNKVAAEVSANLKRIGSNNSVLLLEERAELLHNFLRNGSEGEFEYNEDSIIDSISPVGLEFRTDYFKMGDRYCRGIFLSSMPSYLGDKFTSELMDFNENIMLSIHMQGQDIEKTMRMLNNKLTSLKTEEIKAQESAAKNNRFTFSLNPHLSQAMEEVEEFRNMIQNQNQKVFFTNYVLVHMADTKMQLDDDTKTLQNIASKNLCKLRVLTYQQEEALRTVLPLGVNELKHLEKCLTTESATVLSLPFNSVEYLDNNGFYYGKNTLTGNMIMIDKQSLKNQNSFVLGSPGSGKSFATKREMINSLLSTDADIFVIDPENEYGYSENCYGEGLCKELGGEEIVISINSKTHINPLDMEYDEEEDPLRNKCDFMLTICNKAIGGKDGLTPTEITIIDRVCHKVFKEYIESGYNKEYQPTLVDFFEVLEKEKDDEAKDLAI
ncbi:TrsE protein, partial [human gut metagenome]